MSPLIKSWYPYNRRLLHAGFSPGRQATSRILSIDNNTDIMGRRLRLAARTMFPVQPRNSRVTTEIIKGKMNRQRGKARRRGKPTVRTNPPSTKATHIEQRYAIQGQGKICPREINPAHSAPHVSPLLVGFLLSPPPPHSCAPSVPSVLAILGSLSRLVARYWLASSLPFEPGL